MKSYLGDAVYAELEGADVILTTEDGIVNPTNRIVLEPEVVMQFVLWAIANSVAFNSMFQRAVQTLISKETAR